MKNLIALNWLSPEWNIKNTLNGLKTCLKVEFSTFSQFSIRFRQFARFLKFWPFWPPQAVKVKCRKLITSWSWVEIWLIRLVKSFLVKLKKCAWISHFTKSAITFAWGCTMIHSTTVRSMSGQVYTRVYEIAFLEMNTHR